jgi:hypothetical protein
VQIIESFVFILLLSGKNYEAFQKQHFPGQPLISFQGGACKARKISDYRPLHTFTGQQ